MKEDGVVQQCYEFNVSCPLSDQETASMVFLSNFALKWSLDKPALLIIYAFAPVRLLFPCDSMGSQNG